MLALWPAVLGPPGRLLSSLQAFSCLSCHGHMARRKLFAPGGRGGQQPRGHPVQGWAWQSSHPAAQPQRGPATVTVTGVPAFSHSRPHCCSAQHPSPPGSLPSWSGPLIHRCLFLESGPFSLRVCGEGEQPHGGQPRPSRLLPQAPACCPPTTGAGGLCPQEGGTFRLSSQHILWPVPPILPPTAGAGPSALPGVLSDSPFPRGGGGRVAVRPVGSVSGPSEGLCGHPQEAEDATGPGRGRLS